MLNKTIVNDIVFFTTLLPPCWQRSAFSLFLEIDMIKFPTILTRRNVIGAGAGLAVAGTAVQLLMPASAQADAGQAGAEPFNPHASYRFQLPSLPPPLLSHSTAS